MNKKKVIVFLGDGFEECEGLLAVDLLRRAGCSVVTASVMESCEIVSSHGIHLQADQMAANVDYLDADMLVLPGGIPGTYNLRDNKTVQEQCVNFSKGKYLAAICAAPSVLAGLGLLEGKKATCHPAFEDQMSGAVLTGESVVVSGNIITGQGLGAGIEFALKLVSILVDQETADKIAEGICWR